MEKPLDMRDKPKSPETFEHTDVTVFRVRHGHTEYEGHAGRGEHEINKDLTKEGVEAMEKSAKLIAARIDPGKDIVYVVSSPRARTRHSAEIIRTYLNENGINVAVDEKRKLQNRIIGSNILDEAGDAVPENTPEHADIWQMIHGESPQGEPEATAEVRRRYLAGEIPEIETQESVRERSRNQLTYLTRIAKQIQPKVKKHIVIIQVEHEETLTELLEVASDGERSMLKDTGPEKAEVFELKIPTVDGPMKLTSLQNPDLEFSPINYDPDNREFKS